MIKKTSLLLAVVMLANVMIFCSCTTDKSSGTDDVQAIAALSSEQYTQILNLIYPIPYYDNTYRGVQDIAPNAQLNKYTVSEELCETLEDEPERGKEYFLSVYSYDNGYVAAVFSESSGEPDLCIEWIYFQDALDSKELAEVQNAGDIMNLTKADSAGRFSRYYYSAQASSHFTGQNQDDLHLFLTDDGFYLIALDYDIVSTSDEERTVNPQCRVKSVEKCESAFCKALYDRLCAFLSHDI